MFLEDEDWNDDKAQVLSPAEPQTLLTSPNVKTKAVGKRSLLRTLQTLGSVPDWSTEGPHRGSDSEGDTAEHTKKKRKKKRRKRRHAESDEQQEEKKEGEEEEGEKEDAPVKKRKKDTEGKKVTSSTTEKPQESSKPGENSEAKLSRKQWKNRMKNKRKSKNKFKPHEASEERDEKQTDANGGISCSTDCQAHEVKKKEKTQKSQGSIQTQSERVEMTKTKNTDKDVHKEVNFELNRKAKLKKEKLRRLLQSKETKEEQSGAVEGRVEEMAPEAAESSDPPDPSASLRSRMEQRLDSARFRFINELLYSSSSREAQRMFSQDQEAFWVYHRGYSSQVQRWPQNPVDLIIHFIKTKPASLVVADFGCGDCKIAKSVKNRVHSFDLVSTCDLVTACDMAHVPLKDNSVDIAVFCLSLMGTNLGDFLKEANRVLKRGGFLKIAEVSSRFEDVRSFISALNTLGFKLLSKDTENSHFYSFDFVKTGPAPDNLKKFGLKLKPCVYKKR